MTRAATTVLARRSSCPWCGVGVEEERRAAADAAASSLSSRSSSCSSAKEESKYVLR